MDTAKWEWDDSLDATKAAKQNHKMVYEDEKVRILQVVCPPGNEEPVHTHKYPSTMWVTQPGHLMYLDHKLVKQDSFEIQPRTAQQLNKGEQMPPEGPHSIHNIGPTTYIAYRVEYK